jgi:hypothetical protein
MIVGDGRTATQEHWIFILHYSTNGAYAVRKGPSNGDFSGNSRAVHEAAFGKLIVANGEVH